MKVPKSWKKVTYAGVSLAALVMPDTLSISDMKYMALCFVIASLILGQGLADIGKSKALVEAKKTVDAGGRSVSQGGS